MADEESRPARVTSYTGWVGLAFIVLIVIAIVNGARTEDTGILGTKGGPEEGWRLPRFAAPLVGSGLEGDANIDRDEACKVDVEGAVRICDLFDEPLVMSFWFTVPRDCAVEQDSFDAVAREFGGRVHFLSVNIRTERDELEDLVEERGWSVPVAHDRDGAVSNIYGITPCPTVAYAFPGGRLMSAYVGEDELAPDRLRMRVNALIRASRKARAG
jgi:hypothetical protein